MSPLEPKPETRLSDEDCLTQRFFDELPPTRDPNWTAFARIPKVAWEWAHEYTLTHASGKEREMSSLDRDADLVRRRALLESLRTLGYDVALSPKQGYWPVPVGYHISSSTGYRIQRAYSTPEGITLWMMMQRQGEDICFPDWSQAWAFCFRFCVWLREHTPQQLYEIRTFPFPEKNLPGQTRFILAISLADAQVLAARCLLEEVEAELAQMSRFTVLAAQPAHTRRHSAQAEQTGLTTGSPAPAQVLVTECLELTSRQQHIVQALAAGLQSARKK